MKKYPLAAEAAGARPPAAAPRRSWSFYKSTKEEVLWVF